MKTYVALLRGTNVGGNNKLPMKDLVESLQRLGCQHVQTYIQSGNVVFQLAAPAAKTIGRQLSDAISKSHGFAPKVMLLTATQLASAVKNCPFSRDNGQHLHAFFLDIESNSPDLISLNNQKAESEQFQLRGNVFYLYAPDGIGRSKVAVRAERCLGVSVTARNWNTVLKLQSLMYDLTGVTNGRP